MKTLEEKISVIIPIYNTEKYLARCLESIRRQTYTNIEVLMVDDGSIDRSGEICKQYQLQDSRFSYLFQNNAGRGAARNAGMAAATGEWLSFVDADDYVDSEMLQRLYDDICDEHDEIIACCCIAEIEEGAKENHFFDGDRVFSQDKTDLYMQLLLNQYQAGSYRYTAIGVPWGKLYSAAFLKRCGLSFDVELLRMQDNIFNWQAFICAGRIRYLDKPLYHYTVAHVANYTAVYDEMAAEYLTKVLLRQKELLERTGMAGEKSYREAFQTEALSLYTMGIQKSYFNDKSLTYLEKCRLSGELLKRQPYCEIFGRAGIKGAALKLCVCTNSFWILIYGKQLYRNIKKRMK